MKVESWDFLLGDERTPYSFVGRHQIELARLRHKENLDLYIKYGHEKSTRIIEEREKLAEESIRKWFEDHSPEVMREISLRIAEDAKRNPLVIHKAKVIIDKKIEEKDKVQKQERANKYGTNSYKHIWA